MGSWLSKITAAAALAAAVSVAGPAVASQDIPWTWNSGDHDAEANFKALGEEYHGKGYEPDSYMNWTGPSGSGRWNLGQNGNLQTLNMSWAEGKTVSLNVCQQHNLYPDDCSGKKYGVS
jgi:hypothetical protein